MESLPHFKLLLLVTSILGAVVVTTWRLRETRSVVTARKILIPPMGMATGFFMFVLPATRVPWSWALSALAIGALVLSIPISRTSTLTRVGDEIRMERSRAFLWILLGLVAVRFAARAYVERAVSPLQTGSLFFLLAFGMIARWRVEMFLQYRRLRDAAGPLAAPAEAGATGPW